MQLISKGGHSMSTRKTKATKEKMMGTAEEKVGQLTDNKSLEIKGKVRQGVGKGYEIADDYQHKAEDVKDTVVGTTKEKLGQLTGDHSLELRGKIQKENVDNRLTKKLLYGLGAILAVVFLINRSKKERE